MEAKPLISIMGDSISTFEGCNPAGFRVFYEGAQCEATGVREVRDTWWAQVVDALGGELLVNGSFSGSMVEGAGFPAANSTERVAVLARDGKTPDVVLIFMGINDYGWGGADAQTAGRSSARPVCLDDASLGAMSEPGLAVPAAAEHFGVAYSAMLARLRAAYPQAEVWCCTLCPGRMASSEESTFTYRLRGVPFNAYNDAIRAAARENGCHVADMRALGRDYETLDGTHPTARGMRQFASFVLRAMRAELATERGESLLLNDSALRDAPFLTKPCLPSFADDPSSSATPPATERGELAPPNALVLPDAPPSKERCTKPSCIGCPHAVSTGAKWMLVCTLL